MFWTLALILMAMWVVGMVTSFIFAGLLHILLGLAVVMVALGVVQRLRPNRRLGLGARKPPTSLDRGPAADE